jgi:peptide/nickel transport system substrate-binding protein
MPPRDRSTSWFGLFKRGAGKSSPASFGDQGARTKQRAVHGWDKRLVQSLTSARLPTWRQIRHLPEVLSSSDGLRLRLGSLLFVIGLAIVGVAFYYAHTVFGPARGGELIEGVVGSPRSLNPVLSVSNDVDNDLMRLMYSRLFTVDGDGNLTPDLVSSYDVSPDQKTYTLTIKGGVKWQDGEALTADDVLFTFGLIQDPAWKSPLHVTFKDVTVEKPDDRTIKLTLKDPYSQFLRLLDFGILPRHVWKDVDPQSAPMADASLKPIGSGLFAFDELRRDKRGFVMSYTLKRNEQYYGQLPYLDRITFQFYPDYLSALDALEKRQITSLSFVPRDMRKQVTSLASVTPVSLELPQATAVFFNPNVNAILKDREVRRALIMGIDKGRILFDVLGGDGHPLDRPALPGFSATSTNPIPFNVAGAGALLDSLGWKLDPADGLRKRVTPADRKTKTPEKTETLHLTLTTVDQPESMSVASILKSGWTALGVDVTISAVPASDIHRMVIAPRSYEALLYSQLMAADSDPYPFWHSSQIKDPGLNLAMFNDREADDALEAARKATDTGAREQAYLKFLSVLADQLPAAFLYSPSYTYAIPAGMKGFSGTWVNSPSDRFATVASWYLQTARVWKK